MAPVRLAFALALALLLGLGGAADAGRLGAPVGKTAGKAKAKKNPSRRSSQNRQRSSLNSFPVLRDAVVRSRAAQSAKKAQGKGRSSANNGRIVIDVGGEGAHRGALNLNPGTHTTTTGQAGRPIPNHVKGVGEKLPFAAKAAHTLIVESAPLRPGTAAELARVIKPGGVVRLVHPSEYAATTHPAVIEAIRGRVHQTRKDGVTTTIIVAPASR